MRRLIVCLMLCLLPLQWSWALVHDAAHGVEVGASQWVHAHEGGAESHDKAAHDAGPGAAPLDHTHDCDACANHCAHAHSVALAPAGFAWQSSLPDEQLQLLALLAPPLGALDRIERPKWIAAAHSWQ